MEDPGLLGIGLDQLDQLRRAVGEAQVTQRLGVYGEIARRGAVFGRHVGDGGAVRHTQLRQARPEVLDELADHALLAQNLGDGQHQIGGGGAFRQASGKAEADHLRQKHRYRLAQHAGLGLDAAHAPAQHAQAVDHGGMGIRAHQGVRVREQAAVALGCEHYGRQVLEIHLVHDAGIGRDHAEVVEGRLAPAQQRVAFLVALELEQRVGGEGSGCAELVHLYRVVDDQVGGDERVGAVGIAAQGLERVAHGGEIHHAGDAGEILEQNARGHEADLACFPARPARHKLDVSGLDRAPVFMAQQVL